MHDAAGDAAVDTTVGAAPITITTTVAGQNGLVRFVGTAGQTVAVAATGGSLSATRASAALLGPAGEVVRSVSYCGSACTVSGVALPADGTYTFRWNPAAGRGWGRGR